MKYLGKIYALANSEGEVFYVGATVQHMVNRVGCHISEAKNLGRNPKRKDQIIHDLNFQITATILETKEVQGRNGFVATRKLRDLELKWIRQYMDLGYDLCNMKGGRKKKLFKTKEYVGQVFKTAESEILTEEVKA